MQMLLRKNLVYRINVDISVWESAYLANEILPFVQFTPLLIAAAVLVGFFCSSASLAFEWISSNYLFS